MGKKAAVVILTLVFVATLLVLFWMSEISDDTPLAHQAIALAILLLVGFLLWKQSSLPASAAKGTAIEDRDIPEKLANPIPAVLIKKVNPVATGSSPSESVLSWIGGQPPNPDQAWPVDPVTGERMQHYATLAFSHLNRHLPPGTLPNTGQLSFFICKIDALRTRARGITPDDFKIREISEEQPAAKTRQEGDFPVAAIDFNSELPDARARQDGTGAHQVFGVGLALQDQLEPVQDRQLLLQLGNDEAIGLEGVIQFMIYPKDLRARDWQKTVVVVASD